MNSVPSVGQEGLMASDDLTFVMVRYQGRSFLAFVTAGIKQRGK
jgi:hypothetical protein